MRIFFQQAVFLKSAQQLSQLPPDQGAEIAFVGRSNAGKSSALNAITAIKNLAKTSKTPGRTQLINLFQLTEQYRLVDLPGYGYAAVPLLVKQQWVATLHRYLETRACLRGLCLIMDIRHPLQTLDQQIISWAQTAKLPVHLLLSKADKLSRGAGLATLRQVKKAYAEHSLVSGQVFSAVSGEGILAVRKQLSHWLTAQI